MDSQASGPSRLRADVGYLVAALSALLLLFFLWQIGRLGDEGVGDRMGLQRERNAVVATRLIVAAETAIARYRGAAIAGVAPDERARLRSAVDAALIAAEPAVAAESGGDVGKAWARAKSAWASARVDAASDPPYLGVQASRELQNAIDALEDASGMTYDPNSTTQNLADAALATLPRAMTAISRSHDMAREGIAGGALPLRERLDLTTLVTSLRVVVNLSGDHVDEILTTMAKKIPSRASAFARTRQDAAALAQSGTALRTMLTDGVLLRNRPSLSVAALDAATVRAQRSAQATFEGVAFALDEHLARAQRLNDVRSTYVYLSLLCGAALLVGSMLIVAGLFARRDRRLLTEAEQQSQRLSTELARQRAESALRLSEAQFRAVFDGAAMGIAILDGRRNVVEANDVFRVLFGDRPERVFDGHGPELEEVMAGERDAFEYEYHSLGPSGRELWAHATISRVADESGGTPFAMCMVRDITALKRSERRAQYDKTHDRLTGLPNRGVLEERLRERLRDEGSPDAAFFAVLFVDLDRFKDVNESLGHAAGDFVLTTVSGRLRASVEADDVVARLGSDEFAILVRSLGDILHVESIARRIVASLARPIDLSGRSIYVGGSVGVALASNVYERAEDVMRDADIAMRQAKAAGGGRFAVYDSTMHAQAERRLELTSDLRNAIDRREFRLLYQPILDMESGELVACEALIRWDHPQNGLMNPNEFMALAEQTGFARPIGAWVTQTACEQLRRWDADREFLMHVNVSAAELVEPDFAQRLTETLEANALDAGSIVLEITESVVLDVGTRAHASLDEARERGFKICIDDFGTGYSSLRYLQQFSVDSIKIDRTFVGGKDGELASEPIVRTLLALAESYDVRVVAEGIETERQVRALRASGARLGQGYLFAHPMEADDLAARFPSVLGRSARAV